MAQITLYINEGILKQISTEAKRAHLSLSKWVQGKLVGTLNKSWPAGYFDLFGAVDAEDFKRPEQSQLRNDVRKASL